MEIKVNCPHCGQHLAMDAAASGRQVNCPVCSKPFVVPALAPAAGSAAGPNPRGGMALASMILGVTSILCFGFFAGIPAIILGHLAHNRARKSPAQFTGAGLAVAGFVMGYVGTLISITAMSLFLSKSFQIAREAAQRHPEAMVINSENNLKMIGLAFKIWEGDHNNQFPFNVSQTQGGSRELSQPDSHGFDKNPAPTFMVMSNELSTTRILICPNDPTKQIAANFAALTVNNISYLLHTGPNVNDDNPHEILAVDPINGLVLHCDGTVEEAPQYKGMTVGN